MARRTNNNTMGNKNDKNANDKNDKPMATLTPNNHVDNKPEPKPVTPENPPKPENDENDKMPENGKTSETSETSETKTDLRKKTKWAVIGNVAKCTFPNDETNEFDITKLFPEFDKLNEQQKFTVGYGIKQFLTDKCAFGKDEKPNTAGLIVIMNERYADLCAGKFRSNEKTSKTAKLDKSKVSAIKSIDELLQIRNFINSGIITGFAFTDEQRELLTKYDNNNPAK